MNLKNLFKNEQTLIAEIHNEFDTAQDRLLSQAEKLLSELNIPTETKLEQTASRLKAIGFENTPTVKRAKSMFEKRKQAEQKLVSTKEDAELIQYYKREYPFLKFLTESELERICNKYNLIFAPVKNYIRDVPQAKLKEIESAKPLLTTDNARSRVTITKIKKYWSNRREKIKDFILPPEIAKLYLDCNYSAGRWNIVNNYLFNSKESGEYKIMNHVAEIMHMDTLFIAAPQSHFDLTGLSKKGKHGFMNIQIFEVKDPIVYRYCRGGVQVLSKWSDENFDANDIALQNEINN